MSITENESSVIAVEWIKNRSPSIFNAVKIEGQDTRRTLYRPSSSIGKEIRLLSHWSMAQA